MSGSDGMRELLEREKELRERNAAINGGDYPKDTALPRSGGATSGLARPASPLTPERAAGARGGFQGGSSIPVRRAEALARVERESPRPASGRFDMGAGGRPELAPEAEPTAARVRPGRAAARTASRGSAGPEAAAERADTLLAADEAEAVADEAASRGAPAELEALLDGLPAESQARVLRQRLTAALADAKRGYIKRRRLHKEVRDASAALRTAAADRLRLAEQVQEAEARAARAEARARRVGAGAAKAKEDAEASATRRRERPAGQGAGAEARARRAEEEVGRLKRALAEARAAAGAVAGEPVEAGGSESAAVGALRARLRASERQRADLLQAFRKQMRLIELLKRQRAHVEAARMLSFTEDSFARALEMSGVPEAERVV